jgi:hypothetical protein
MGGGRERRPRRAFFYDPAAIHHRHAVCMASDNAKVMGDQDQTDIVVLAQARQKREDLKPGS